MPAANAALSTGNFALVPSQIAKALGGDVSGNTINAPGPGHSSSDRSLSVTVRPDAPDGFLVHSHSGDDAIVQRLRTFYALLRGASPSPPPSNLPNFAQGRLQPRLLR